MLSVILTIKLLPTVRVCDQYFLSGYYDFIVVGIEWHGLIFLIFLAWFSITVMVTALLST